MLMQSMPSAGSFILRRSKRRSHIMLMMRHQCGASRGDVDWWGGVRSLWRKQLCPKKFGPKSVKSCPQLPCD